jgi:hypothetical protein
MTGRNTTPEKALLDNLKRITNCSTIIVASDIPADALTSVVESSNSEEHRQAIMQHLRGCLTESSGKQWRRPYSALLLIEVLLKRGSPELLAETAEGRHFDLVQRLSFLEQSEFLDKRVQGMVRSKAAGLRKEILPLLENADAKDRESASDTTLETSTTGSPDSAPCSRVSSVGFGSDDVSSKSGYEASSDVAKAMVGFGSDDVANDSIKEESADVAKVMILNNIVRVGHRDDTSSESECNEGRKDCPGQMREAKRMSSRARNERSQQSELLTFETEKETLPSTAQTVDLLDF